MCLCICLLICLNLFVCLFVCLFVSLCECLFIVYVQVLHVLPQSQSCMQVRESQDSDGEPMDHDSGPSHKDPPSTPSSISSLGMKRSASDGSTEPKRQRTQAQVADPNWILEKQHADAIINFLVRYYTCAWYLLITLVQYFISIYKEVYVHIVLYIQVHMSIRTCTCTYTRCLTDCACSMFNYL